jgi:hypothetical protein
MTDWKTELERRSMAKKARRKAENEQIKLGKSHEWMEKRTKTIFERKLKEYDAGRKLQEDDDARR